MINRTVLRVRVFQQLYAHYIRPELPQRELLKQYHDAVNKTYGLYIYLLDLPAALTRKHDRLTEARRKKFRPTQEDLNPNVRLSHNRLTDALVLCSGITEYLQKFPYAWSDQDPMLHRILSRLTSTDLYRHYTRSADTFESDRTFWVDILSKQVFRDEELNEYLEEANLYWDNPLDTWERITLNEPVRAEELEAAADALHGTPQCKGTNAHMSPVEIAKEFVLKSIKLYDPERMPQGFNEVLLPPYPNPSDKVFGEKLLKYALAHRDEYNAIIDEYCNGRNPERMVGVDKLILLMALTEALHFPDVPLSVTANEYIELAKNYSTPKSGAFINGVLGKLFEGLRKTHKLLK